MTTQMCTEIRLYFNHSSSHAYFTTSY